MLDLKQMVSPLKGLWKSDIVLVVACFFLLDLIVRVGFSIGQQQPLQLAFDAPYRSRIWYATKDFLNHKNTPDVVLLGASDMTCAIYGAEATFLNATQYQLIKHESECLNRKLAALGSSYKSSFCFGIPGEMPCDAYFIVNTLLPHREMPKAIVFSISPRDFCDATFGDLSATDIYKLMSKLGGIGNMELSCRRSIWDKLDYGITKAISICGHKWEFASWQHHATESLISKLFGVDFEDVRMSPEIRRAALIALPEDFSARELCEFPYDPKHPMFLNNVAEYRSRYRQFKKRIFDQQLDFFRKTCELCQRNGINLVVINSPLTSENRAMIPPQMYDFYLAQTTQTVRSMGGTYVDMNKPGLFEHDDFFDSIHLNGKGGVKFVDQIARALSEGSRLASSPKNQGQ